jgi:hypothetical protein
MDQNELTTQIQLDIREITTLLKERKSTIEKNAVDIDKCFKGLRVLENDVTEINTDLTHMKSDIGKVLEGQADILIRLSAIEKDNHHTAVICKGALGLFGTIVAGAAVKFFLGG